MARIVEPSSDDIRAWKEWASQLPADVEAIALKLDPWSLYRMKSTGHRVTFYSIEEHENSLPTVKVAITGQFNRVMFDTIVFGIDPDDLEPCDLPKEGEPLGTMMTAEQVDENIDEIRLQRRPDLFTRGPNGEAIRKDSN